MSWADEQPLDQPVLRHAGGRPHLSFEARKVRHCRANTDLVRTKIRASGEFLGESMALQTQFQKRWAPMKGRLLRQFSIGDLTESHVFSC